MTPCKGGRKAVLSIHNQSRASGTKETMMKKFITVILALAIAALASSAFATATWEHFNADPAYPSREAAIADAPRVMRQAGYPEPVISLLTEAMKKPGVRTHVTNGMRLDFMRSGKSALWRNVEVKFKKPPREASMEYSAPAEEWTVEWNGTAWTTGVPDVCNNTYGKRVFVPPQQPPAPPAKAPTLSQYALQINCMSDRADGFWRNKYDTAKARRAENLARTDINRKGMLPYYEVFTQAPFGDMLAERKIRPLDCRFLVRFLKKEPVLDIRSGDSAEERAKKYGEYLQQFQYPTENNVLTGQWVTTGARGWVIIPITVPLDQFEAVLVQPENLGEVLEPLIAVRQQEFARQSNPIHIWEVKQ